MGVRVDACDDRPSLALAAELFAEYRDHYGARRGGEGATHDWLAETVGAGLLTAFVAHAGVAGDERAVGLATTHVLPASLALGRSWQLRDLYVRPEARRQGVAAALVAAVRRAAQEAGATRLSLVTEVDNHGALRLYERLGFARVDGLTTVSIDVADG